MNRPYQAADIERSSASASTQPQKQVTDAEVAQLRRIFHEMANTFTGILVCGGLLHSALSDDPRQRYTADLCQNAERGAQLVRTARALVVEDGAGDLFKQ